MGGTSKTTQTQTQQSSRDPWAPTIDPLKGIIGQLNNQIPNAVINPTEQGAFDTLTQNAQAGNPYAGQIGNFATDMLNGGGANAQAPQVQGAYDAYAKNIAPWASGGAADPTQNSALQSLLSTVRDDVSNSVNGYFAGAGRDLSGANAMALGRGITQGIAPVLLDAQRTALGAAGDLYNAGNTTSGLLSGMNQTSLQNRGMGVDASTAALQARDSGANQLLNISQQQRNLPISNLGNLSGLLTPIASLGGSGTQQGQMQGSYTMSPAQQAWGWMNAFGQANPFRFNYGTAPTGGGGGG